jgi:hypothetical protein
MSGEQSTTPKNNGEFSKFESTLRKILSVPKEPVKRMQGKANPKKPKKKKS